MNKLNLKKYNSILIVLLLSIVLFVLHKALFFLFGYQNTEKEFCHSLLVLYSFFSVLSIIIMFFIIKIKDKNINSVGNLFVLLTFIEMVFAYILLKPILDTDGKYIAFEKVNFFMIFAIFLTMQTIVTIRILNSKP